MKGQEETFGLMDIFIVLVMVMVSEEYISLKHIKIFFKYSLLLCGNYT